MPAIDDLLRTQGEAWRAEVDALADERLSPTPVPPARSRWRSPRVRAWTAAGVLGTAAAVVLAVTLVPGSTSGGRGTSSSFGSDVGGGPLVSAKAAPGAAAPAAGAAAGGATEATGTLGEPAAGRSSAPAPTLAAPSALILTGSVSLTVPANADVDRAATRATALATGAGGRVDSDTRSADGQHTATLVLRVPNAALPGVTTAVTALGTVTARTLQTKDVTAQVADVTSRVTSARAAIAALTRLYAQTTKIGDLVSLESALAARQADLEALEAQQRALTAQTTLATLTVTITVQAPKPAPTHRHSGSHGGFAAGLRGGWHGFTTAAKAVATAVGAALPFAVLVLVLGAAGLLVRRRRRPRLPAPFGEG